MEIHRADRVHRNRSLLLLAFTTLLCVVLLLLLDGWLRTVQARLGSSDPDTVRRWLATTRVGRMQLDTLRLRLLKIGGRVWQWSDRVRLRLASSHPGQPLWDHLAAYHRLHE